MILADSALHELLIGGSLAVRPLAPNAVQPASIDLRLGPILKVVQRYGPEPYRDHHLIDDGAYTLGPDVFVLASTLEWVEIPSSLVGVLAGKSTLARLGLCVEDAGYIDPGFRGNVTLELSNRASRPVVLTNGLPIAQLRLHTMLGVVLRPYGSEGLGSHYQDSHGTVPARTGRGS